MSVASGQCCSCDRSRPRSRRDGRKGTATVRIWTADHGTFRSHIYCDKVRVGMTYTRKIADEIVEAMNIMEVADEAMRAQDERVATGLMRSVMYRPHANVAQSGPQPHN